MGIGTLNCIYFVLFAVGVGYAIIAAIMGHLSHFDLPGFHLDLPGGHDMHIESPFVHDITHDVDHPEVGLSPLSPITIAVFITTFGGVGLILNNLTPLPLVLNLFLAAVSGVTLSGVIFLLYTRLLVAAQGSSEIQRGELVGRSGEITAPIPAGGIGEVAMVVRGTRVRSPARSADGNPIPRGTLVEVVEETGNVVVVKNR